MGFFVFFLWSAVLVHGSTYRLVSGISIVNAVVVGLSHVAMAKLSLGVMEDSTAFSVAALDSFRSEDVHDAMGVLPGYGDGCTQTYARRLLLSTRDSEFFFCVKCNLDLENALNGYIIYLAAVTSCGCTCVH